MVWLGNIHIIFEGYMPEYQADQDNKMQFEWFSAISSSIRFTAGLGSPFHNLIKLEFIAGSSDPDMLPTAAPLSYLNKIEFQCFVIYCSIISEQTNHVIISSTLSLPPNQACYFQNHLSNVQKNKACKVGIFSNKVKLCFCL